MNNYFLSFKVLNFSLILKFIHGSYFETYIHGYGIETYPCMFQYHVHVYMGLILKLIT